MNPPPPRIREVLSVLRDLSPLEARALLAQVVATLDQVEVLALRNSLPAAALKLLPGCVGAAIEPGAAVDSVGDGVPTVPVLRPVAAPSAPRGVGAWATGPVLPSPAAEASVPPRLAEIAAAPGASGFSAVAAPLPASGAVAPFAPASSVAAQLADAVASCAVAPIAPGVSSVAAAVAHDVARAVAPSAPGVSSVAAPVAHTVAPFAPAAAPGSAGLVAPMGLPGPRASAPVVSCGLGVATISLFAGVAGPPAVPSYAVATVMNLAPMPWELPEPPAVRPVTPATPVPGTETGKLIAAAVPSTRKRVRNAIAVLAGAIGLGLATSLLWSGSDAPAAAPDEPVIAATPAATPDADDDEVVSLVPPPPAREYATISAAKVVKVKKTISRSTTRKPAPAVSRSQPAEWASPFERRH